MTGRSTDAGGSAPETVTHVVSPSVNLALTHGPDPVPPTKEPLPPFVQSVSCPGVPHGFRPELLDVGSGPCV